WLCCRCCWRVQPWPDNVKHIAASSPDLSGATLGVDNEKDTHSRCCCAADGNIGSAARGPRLGQAPRRDGGPVRRVRLRRQHRRQGAAQGHLALHEGRPHYVRRRRLPALHAIQEPATPPRGNKDMPAPGPRGRRGARGPPDIHGVHPLRGDGRGAPSRVPARGRHHTHLQQRKLLRKKMWQLLAIVLSAVVLFYLGAFYLTVAAWLNAIGHLFRGNFIRASIWACIGFGMLCWWQGENTIPDPWDFHAWLTNSAWVVGIGVLATFARFYNRHRR